jgi:hypothetical protein
MRLPGRVLEPVERLSEILFGLIMALTITGGQCGDSRSLHEALTRSEMSGLSRHGLVHRTWLLSGVKQA